MVGEDSALVASCEYPPGTISASLLLNAEETTSNTACAAPTRGLGEGIFEVTCSYY